MVIVFEGIDGTGKSTVARRIFEEFNSLFPGKFFLASEPSKTELGIELKNILTSGRFDLNIFEQTLLFTADRSYTIRKFVIPYSLEGKVILMDRSFVSTYTYQIMNLEDESYINLLTNLTERSIENLFVDILFYFDCPSEISLQRIGEKDGIEKKGSDFIEKVRNNYKKFIKLGHKSIKRIIEIDSTKPLEEVYSKVKLKIMEEVGFIV
ncbi:MAG: dTMP kinase [Brevinematia bacterium]